MWVPEAFSPRERLLTEHAAIVRPRRWMGRGQTTVTVGQMVQAADTIAELVGTKGVRLIDAATALGVAPDKVKATLQVEIGATVAEGQVLAKRGGLFRRSLNAPVAGTVVHVDQRGVILLRTQSDATTVKALLRGEVTTIHQANDAIVITAQGAVLQGLWSNGKANAGPLRLLVSSPTDSASGTRINAGLRGTVLVVGATIESGIMERAQHFQVGGIIAGSMDGALLPLALSVPYPIVLLEGFGILPLNDPTFTLLAELDGREATVGALNDPTDVPEILVPRGSTPREDFGEAPLAQGDRVRIISEPYIGQLGTVDSSTGQRQRLPNRLNAAVCMVRLDRGLVVPVPYVNVERLIT